MSTERTPRLALALASVGGIGYAPFASGTFGSLPGLLLYWALIPTGGTPAVLAAILLLFAVGLWAADVAERHWGGTDPGRVVIDETVGQLIALLFHSTAPLTLFAAFFLFRLFDVLKPFPARRLESLHGGRGIMADDVIAGIYANLALHFLVWALPGWFGGA